MGQPKKAMGIKEIAKRASVSIATVDRVIHNRSGVAESTRKKILEIIKEIDYQPNILASRLKSNKDFTLGVLIPKISENTNFWEAPYNGIMKAHDEVKRYGINIKMYLFELSDAESFKEASDNLLADKIDGIVLSPSFSEESRLLARKLDKKKIPYIFIDAHIAGKNNLSYIGPNLYHSGFVGAELTQYALHSEEDTVLVMNISKTEHTIDNLKKIERGFLDFFIDKALPNPVNSVQLLDGNFALFKQELIQILNNKPKTKAIFVTNSRVFSIARVLSELGRKDIFLVGFDFIEENKKYLENNSINYLICHKPEEQGYRSIMALYQHLILMQTIEKVQYMPIDIVTKGSAPFYVN
ncbi:LacI family DNA-binding transcriptional regulator [Membranihabitans marinus]|uniref:LacI family DNA-binding transcriptional regulator n=1 Tax=Membranihabitans marinus TaxID=1227546 RepID=UPI001F185467|nr:LacI family DNA-binding transcriptional regulator [Membranihabitans marinus]